MSDIIDNDLDHVFRMKIKDLIEDRKYIREHPENIVQKYWDTLKYISTTTPKKT